MQNKWLWRRENSELKKLIRELGLKIENGEVFMYDLRIKFENVAL